jgi:hypothetical protein
VEEVKDKDKDKLPPALYEHCSVVYAGMLQEAEARETENGIIIVWKGMLTKFVTSQMNLSIPYYTHVTRALIRMGCIHQLRRGGGSSGSLWQLITEPTIDLWNATAEKKMLVATKITVVNQQIADLTRRVGRLEQALEKVMNE